MRPTSRFLVFVMTGTVLFALFAVWVRKQSVQVPKPKLGPRAATAADKELIEAARTRSLERLRSALAQGANPKVYSPQGEPVIYVAADAGTRRRVSTSHLVEALLQAGADPDAPAPYAGLAGTALMPAVVREDGEAVRALLTHDANPNPPNCYYSGRATTPLSIAAMYGNLEIVDMLLLAGADPNGQSGEPLRAVAAASDIAKIDGHEADIAPVVRRLLQAGARPDIPDKHGVTAIKAADLRHRSDIVSMLQAVQ